MFGLGKAEKQAVPVGIDTLAQRIALVEARVTALELNEGVFRDKVLRKIQQRAVQEEPEEPRPKLSAGSRVRR